MKLKKYLLLSIFVWFVSLNAQYIPVNFQSMLVPKYMGSSISASYRLPVVFRAKVTGLKPNSMYKYGVAGLSWSDFTSTSYTAGAGVMVSIDSNGYKQITTRSFSSGSGHDTFYSTPAGEYDGWFGFYYTSDTRFTPGKYITPGIAVLGPDTFKFRLMDSIKVLEFDVSGSNTNAGSAIWGSSFASAKNIVALYDNTAPSNRPVTITYIESEGQTFSNVPAFYSNNVNGKTGNWGTIIPNNLANGIRRIENIELLTANVVYANTDADGIWGPSSKSTVDPRAGLTSPIKLDSVDCPLKQPMVEFWARTSTVSEGVGTTKVYVKRMYSNSVAQSVTLKVAGGDATKGSTDDYNLTEPKTITFNPGATAIDSTSITINDDNIAEGDETIVLRLENAVNTTIGTEVAHTITIKDNDIPTFTISKAVTVKETAGKIGFVIKSDKPMVSQTTLKLLVKSKGVLTDIPGEFKLGNSGSDSTLKIGKTTGGDSLMIYASVIDDLIGDPNDSVLMVIRKVSGLGVIGADSLCRGIITDNDGPAYVKFSKATLSLSEGAGSFDIQIDVISKTDATADIRLSMIQSASTATEGSDFTFSPATQLITIDNTTPSSIIVNVPVSGDNVFEPNEKILFRLLNFSNAVVQKPDSLIVTILNDDYPIYKINTINKQTSAAGTPDSANVRCRTFGTVYGVNMQTSGVAFTIMDNTGGIGVSSTKTFGYTVKEGDSVMIQGKISNNQGMAQLDNLDTIIRITNNRTLVKPTVITKTSETTESKLVTLKRVKLVNSSDWPSTALSANSNKYVPVISSSGSYDTLNIDAETNLDGTTAPAGYFDVTGLGSQFDNTSPYKSRYVLSPRYTADIVASVLPKISFDKVKDTIYEPADSIIMKFTVNPVDENFSVAIVKIGGTAVSPQDYDYTTQTINVIKNKPFYTVKANNSDDGVVDGDKTLVFAIRNLVGAGEIGQDSVATILIKDNEVAKLKNIREGGISLMPNPSTGVVYLKAVQNIKNVEISDLTGKVIYSSQPGATQSTINLSAPAGIYTLKVALWDGSSFGDKLILSK